MRNNSEIADVWAVIRECDCGAERELCVSKIHVSDLHCELS